MLALLVKHTFIIQFNRPHVHKAFQNQDQVLYYGRLKKTTMII